MKTRDRAPGLDGVRALAVLVVIGFHEGASGLPGGFLGVDIFFVLSGFLITDLLIARYDRTGRLHLADFWTRRARRLLPALAVMLVVVTAAAAVIEPAQEASLRPALLAAATYTSNWYQILHHVSYFAAISQAAAPPPFDHLWSLAIEEQFYLVWPLIVLCVIVRLDARRARVICALTGAAVSALVMVIQYTPGGDPSAVYYGTDTHASALLIGAALALAWPLRRLAAIPAAHTGRLDMAGIVGLVVLAWAVGHFSGGDPVVYPVGLLLAALAAAGLIAAAGPPAAAAPGGLLPQVANGERVSSESRSTPAVPSPSSAPSPVGRAPARTGATPTPPPATCRPAQPRVSGSQVTAVGDSVMLASAAALEASLPGVYIDAKVDRQLATGLALVRSLAAAGRLRHVVVFSLG